MNATDQSTAATAARALAHFGVQPTALEPTGSGYNTVYRVQTTSQTYALRLSPHGRKPSAWRRAEGMWLRVLGEAGLRVPAPVGDFYVPDVDGSGYDAALLTWVDGDRLTPDRYSTATLGALGRFTARMHTIAQTFTPPPDFVRPRLDADALTGKHAADGTPSQYASPAEDALFTDAHRAILAATRVQVAASFAALHAEEGADTFGLIHADLIAANVVFDTDGHIGVIDFDECAFGAFLYDLAPALWLVRHAPDYAAIRAALWDGYTSVRPQPDAHLAHLEVMVAARHAASCRWLAANADHPAIGGDIQQKLAARFAELRAFLETGTLARTGETR